MKGYSVWIETRNRKEGGLETKDKIYYVIERWKIGVEIVNGKKKIKYKTVSHSAGPSRAVASEILNSKRNLTISKNNGIPDLDKSLGVAVEKYLNNCLGMAKGTQKNYVWATSILLKWFNSERKLQSITKDDFMDFKSSLFQKYKQNGVINILKFVKIFFSFCIKSGWITQNPCLGCLKGLKEKEVARFLTDSEISTILYHCLNARSRYWHKNRGELRDICLIALSTGMREAEIVSLKKAWITNVISIPPGIRKRGKPKIMIVPENLWPIINRYMAIGTQEELFPGWSPNRLKQIFRRAVTRARRSGAISGRIRFHDWRHTFASRHLQYGDKSNLATLQDCLGHSSIATTRRYSHFEKSHLQNVVNSIPNPFLDQKLNVVS